MNTDALLRLVRDLGAQSVHLANSGWVRARCPSGWHEDHRASWGVDSRHSEHVCHCFLPTCPASGPLLHVVARLRNTSVREARRWIEGYGPLDIVDRAPVSKAMTSETTEEMLRFYESRRPSLYLLNRGIDIHTQAEFRIGVDEKQRAVVPWFDFEERLIGVERYAKDFKQALPERGKHLFGRVVSGAACLIAEGALDALRGWALGERSILALGTASPSTAQLSALRSLPVSEYVIGLDYDEAGFAGGRMLYEGLRDCVLVTLLNYPKVMGIDGKPLKDVGGFPSARLLAESKERRHTAGRIFG